MTASVSRRVGNPYSCPMLKFLRKYQMWILVIGGSLLMVAFLVPQGFQQAMSNPRGPVIGRLDGVKIRDGDRASASVEMEVLQRLNPQMLQRFGVEPRDTLHWMLLRHEAERMGLMPTVEAADDAVAALMPDEMIAEAAMMARTEESDVRRAVRSFMGIQRLFELVEFSPKLSDVRGRALARELGDEVVADVLLIEGDRARGEIAPPTEAEIAEHFEAHKATQPGGGDLGVGYAQGPRIKFEWIALRRTDMRAGVNLDPVETYKRWSTNRTLYPGEFEPEQAKVEEDLTNLMIDDAMQRAHLRISAEVKRSIERLPQVEGRFRVLPDDWAQMRPTMSRLAEVAAEAINERRSTESESSITVQPPVVEARTDRWIAMQDLWGVTELAMAQVTIGANRFPLGQVLFSVREILPSTPLAAQVGVPLVDYAGVDAAGNRLYVIVTDARPQGPPDSLEEVREQVVKDMMRLRGFEQLKGELESMRDLAIREGLPAVAALYPAREGSEAVPVLEGMTIGRESMSPGSPEHWGIVARVDHEAIREAVLTAAEAIDPLADPALLSASEATLGVPVPQRQAVAIVRVRRVRPATFESYRLGGDTQAQVFEQRRMMEGIDIAEWPYTRERLEQRHNWAPVGRWSEPEDEES